MNRQKNNQSGRLALAIGLVIASTGTVQAQNNASGPRIVEEVFVTARKKEERLQDVPIAITAIDSKLLEETHATGLEDVARLTPGFAFERTVGALAQPSIRGIVQGRVSNPVQNIATYFNGVYLQRSYQIDTDMLNMERVEIYKGPQSALFGRNAFGGAISYVTRKPNLEEIEASAEISLGSDELEEFKGVLSLPLLAGKAGLSVAYTSTEFDGTWENENDIGNDLSDPEGALYTDGNVAGYDKEGYMVQFYAEPTEDLSVGAFYNHRKVFVESPANYQISSLSAIRAGGTTNCYPFEEGAANPNVNDTNFGMYCGEIPVDIELADGEPRPPGLLVDRRGFGQDTESDVWGLDLNYQVTDTITLSYNYGHTEADAVNMGTLTGDPVNGTFFGQTLLDSRGNGDIESDSHDFRFNYENDKFRVLVGVFVSDVENYDYGASYVVPPNSNSKINNIPFPAGNLLGSVSATQRDEEVFAYYGLISYAINDAWNITVEGRQTEEKITQQSVDFDSGNGVGEKFDETFDYFTPRISIDYRINDDLMIYASAAKGTKSGGFNPQATLPEEQVYDPEENQTYELGLKGTAFDRRLSYEAAIYTTDWDDLQGSRGQTGAEQGDPLIIGNFSSAEIKGLELSALYDITETVTLNVGASVSDAEYADGAQDSRITRSLCQDPATLPPGSEPCPYTDDVGGNQIPRTPKYQANLGIAYDTPIGDFVNSKLNFFARLNYSYQSKQYADPLNTAYVPSRDLFDGSLGVYNDNWRLQLWGKNLTDEEYVSYVFATIGIFEGAGTSYAPILGDKRTWGVTLSYDY